MSGPAAGAGNKMGTQPAKRRQMLDLWQVEVLHVLDRLFDESVQQLSGWTVRRPAMSLSLAKRDLVRLLRGRLARKAEER